MIDHVAASRATDVQTRQVLPLLHDAAFAVAYYARSRGEIVERVIGTKS